jgi:hypothetical protein
MGSLDSSDGKFLRRWAKRGLRDQAGIYAAPFHRSELKWVIGLPAVTLGLIAIDKHASGALSRNGTSASTDISDVGLFATAGAVGVLLLDGETRGNSHALETGVLGAEARANSGVVYATLQKTIESPSVHSAQSWALNEPSAACSAKCCGAMRP